MFFLKRVWCKKRVSGFESIVQEKKCAQGRGEGGDESGAGIRLLSPLVPKYSGKCDDDGPKHQSDNSRDKTPPTPFASESPCTFRFAISFPSVTHLALFAYAKVWFFEPP